MNFKFPIFLEKNSKTILFVSILAYFLFFSFLSLKKYQGFDYNLFDLAIFNQVFYNTIHGRIFDMTINLHNYLGDHFTPIIFLLLPIYAIKNSPITLLIFQSLIIALTAWPIYLIACRVLLLKRLALFVSCAWLFNPFVHSANLYEFHLLPIAPFLLLFVFYFYLNNNFKLFLLFFVLALLVREDISLLLISFSLISYLDKKRKKWILFSLLVPIAYFILATGVSSQFSVDGNYKFFIYYSWLGGETLPEIIISWLKNPLAFLAHIFSFSQIFNILFIFLPFLFIPFLKPKYLLISTIPFLEFILAAAGFNFMVYSTHYVMFFMPAIFIAFIFSLKYLLNRGKFFASRHFYSNWGFFKIIFLFSLLYFCFTFSPARPLFFKTYNQSESNLKNDFISLIDPEASLAADLNTLAKVSSRQIVYPTYYAYFGYSQFGLSEFRLPPVDYILTDTEEFLKLIAEKNSDIFWIKKERDLSDNWRGIINNYELLEAKNDMLLWQNKNKASKGLLWYEFIDQQNPDDFLIDYSYDKTTGILKLVFNKKTDQSKDVLIRFYKNDRHFDVPLGYGIWPMNQWPEDKSTVFYHYLSNDVESFRIFQWYGENKLGLVREVYLDLQIEPIGELIAL